MKERKEEVNNKSSIRGTFRFHSVGQGLFYSGILNQKINSQHRVFTFVYDCGTSSSKAFLDREIDDFKLLLPKVDGKRHLDLLVISHLHDDHVNGLERLLSGVSVETVVMSYVNDGLRLLAQLESEDDSEFSRQFYSDPLNWLRLNGARRILLLGAEGQDYYQDSLYENYRRIIDSTDIQISPEDILRIENTSDSELVYLKHNIQLRVPNHSWEFSFENLCATPNITKKYFQTVEDFKRNHLVTLEQILKNRRLMKELREKLNSITPGGNAINRTSVVLLHNPAADPYTMGDISCMNMKPLHIKSRTLLTGDICLNANETLETVDQLISSDGDSLLLMQYPHHGAKYSHLGYFSLAYPEYTVTSYGIHNRFGHPDTDVVAKMRRFIHVNERNAFDYIVYSL